MLEHLKFVIIWVVTPCSVVAGYQRFGGSCCLHLQGTATNSAITAVKYHKSRIIGFVLHFLSMLFGNKISNFLVSILYQKLYQDCH